MVMSAGSVTSKSLASSGAITVHSPVMSQAQDGNFSMYLSLVRGGTFPISLGSPVRYEDTESLETDVSVSESGSAEEEAESSTHLKSRRSYHLESIVEIECSPFFPRFEVFEAWKTKKLFSYSIQNKRLIAVKSADEQDASCLNENSRSWSISPPTSFPKRMPPSRALHLMNHLVLFGPGCSLGPRSHNSSNLSRKHTSFFLSGQIRMIPSRLSNLKAAYNWRLRLTVSVKNNPKEQPLASNGLPSVSAAVIL